MIKTHKQSPIMRINNYVQTKNTLTEQHKFTPTCSHGGVPYATSANHYRTLNRIEKHRAANQILPLVCPVCCCTGRLACSSRTLSSSWRLCWRHRPHPRCHAGTAAPSSGWAAANWSLRRARGSRNASSTAFRRGCCAAWPSAWSCWRRTACWKLTASLLWYL